MLLTLLSFALEAIKACKKWVKQRKNKEKAKKVNKKFARLNISLYLCTRF